jgi:hypothetical protein
MDLTVTMRLPDRFTCAHRKQSLEELVVATVALAPRETEHARNCARLEHGAHDMRRHPEPILVVGLCVRSNWSTPNELVLLRSRPQIALDAPTSSGFWITAGDGGTSYAGTRTEKPRGPTRAELGRSLPAVDHAVAIRRDQRRTDRGSVLA